MSGGFFKQRRSIEQIEESTELAPRFDENGLIPVVTTDHQSGEVLMLGHMNSEALALTIKTGVAHYWSRSRDKLWRKGETSGFVQQVVEMRIDDDQDSVWLSVSVQGSGASCHVGYKSCFYRTVPIGEESTSTPVLTFVEEEKIFDPKAVYGDAPNPTRV